MAGLDIWQHDLTQLRAAARELSDAMNRAAVELRDTGAEPPERLLQQMQQFRADFRRLRDCVVEERSGDVPLLGSLNDLDAELKQREELQAAMTLVHRAAGLQTRTGEAFGPMFDRWHSQILETRLALQTGRSTANVMELLQTGRHPLVVAMRLADGGDDMTDDDWGAAMETVSGALGRDLATALARGRLVVGEPVAAQSIHPLL
ncbi:MAG TPA: hypothetical protein VFG20_17995 [Planctomycetaceae bacterium]|nr:hypothetical protein [Planctomycetaceae bacterium]